MYIQRIVTTELKQLIQQFPVVGLIGPRQVGKTTLAKHLINDIKDTQCGIKMFEHNAAKQIFSRQKTKRFSFDMEILTIAQSLGYAIKEVPVHWEYTAGSKLRAIRDSLKTLFDLFYIKLNLWCGRYE